MNAWHKLTSGSTNRQIFGAALTVGLLTIAARLATVARELVVARAYGTGDVLDAFLIAWMVPGFLVNLIAGSFNAAFIPTYIRVREEEGQESAQRLFAATTAWSLGLLTVVTLIAVVLAPFYVPHLAAGFSLAKLRLTIRLLLLLSPVVLLSSLITMWGALLNAGERFALAAAAAVITPLVAVVIFLSCIAWGIDALAIGTVCGAMVEAAVLGLAVHRTGISVRPRWQGLDAPLRLVLGQFAPMLAGAFLMSSTMLVDGAMAATLQPGSVASLNYGNRVVGLVVGLISVAVGTAVTPYFSSMTAREDWTGVRYTFGRCLRLVMLATVPLTIVLIAVAQPLVSMLFERGSFTSHDTRTVAFVHTLFALQIPFFSAGILTVRAISSLRANHILMWAAGLNLMLNVVLNFLFMRWWGVAGIALSTSAVYLFSFLFCWVMLNMQISSVSKQGAA